MKNHLSFVLISGYRKPEKNTRNRVVTESTQCKTQLYFLAGYDKIKSGKVEL
jgi:hypothetical protein